jgi:HlyD family secretion protein
VKRFRIWVIFGVSIAAIGTLVFFVHRNRTATKIPTIVRVEEMKPGELIETVSAPGETEPTSRVEISAKTSGRIAALPYKEGDRVTKGDPTANPPTPPSLLVQLDSKELESNLLSAQAHRAAQAAQIEVENARIASQEASLMGSAAAVEQARTDLQRQKKLIGTHDISQTEFDQAKLKLDGLLSQYKAALLNLDAAKLNLKVQEHNLQAADATIAQARETLSYTTIVSPIDGVVTRLNAKVGEMVVTGMMNNPGTKILEIGDLSQMILVARVDEADVSKLEVGQKARIHVDAYPNREFTGTVHTIALSSDMTAQETKYYKTEILLERDGGKLHSGLTANMDIETRKNTGVIAVPSQAVMTREIDSLPLDIRDTSPQVDKTKTYATVVFRYRGGKAVITPVKIGSGNLTQTILEAGVRSGDKVIVGPYKELEKLGHDQAVKDERETPAPKKDPKTGSPESKKSNDSHAP